MAFSSPCPAPRWRLSLLVLTTLLAAVLAIPAQDATASSARSISITDDSFEPKWVDVKVGDKVTWWNNSKKEDDQSVTGSGWDSGVIGPGGHFTQKFAEAGTFSYISTTHPKMSGTVNVVSETAAPAAAPGSNPSSDRLPTTGIDALPMAVVGLLLLTLGLALRRLAPLHGPSAATS